MSRELINQTTEEAAKTAKFINTGEVPVPLLPVSKAEKIKNGYKDAIAGYINPLLKVLLHPTTMGILSTAPSPYEAGENLNLLTGHISKDWIIIARDKEKMWSIIFYIPLEKSMPKDERNPRVITRIESNPEADYYGVSCFDWDFIADIRKLFPLQQERWELYQPKFRFQGLDHYRAEKPFEPDDLVPRKTLLPAFVGGLHDLFSITNRRIAATTLTETEAGEIAKIVAACTEATGFLLNAIGDIEGYKDEKR